MSIAKIANIGLIMIQNLLYYSSGYFEGAPIFVKDGCRQIFHIPCGKATAGPQIVSMFNYLSLWPPL